MADWNHLTQTMALAIDNDREELEAVLALASSTLSLVNRTVAAMESSLGGEAPDVAVEREQRRAVRDVLKSRYQDRFHRICDPDHRSFPRKVAGMLLNEAVGEIDWFGLADHYLTQVKERQQARP